MRDRLSGPLTAIARFADPRSLYSRMYGGRVRAQSEDLRLVDVAIDDPLLPETMSNVPIYIGLPGARVRLRLVDETGAPVADERGAREEIAVLIGWENGRADRPFAIPAMGTRGGTREVLFPACVQSVAFAVTSRLELGQDGASEALLLGSSYRKQELRVDAAILAFCSAVATAIGADGGIPAPKKLDVATFFGQLNDAIIKFNQHDYLSTVVGTV